ncbi:hypothetical protein D9757_012781 [Collybiopsis confluens]|uniref:D-lactate dehydratase n=1 Tax=Collybiopsis confluens TaxID=2823264 RepID=A0A8H5CUU3_9AGAR|nr:hypothetical protein D9757_012781 [Collybiopsis confluens]
MPSALILIADGTEEMEFTITYDTLVRAGVDCKSAFVHNDEFVTPPAAKGSRGIKIVPDGYFEPADSGPDKFDALVVPGGAKGAETISQNSAVQKLVRDYLAEGKLVGMICAGMPDGYTYLGRTDFAARLGSLAALTSGLPKQPLTSHPSVIAQLQDEFIYSEDSVVVSNNLITSRGPGKRTIDPNTPFAKALASGTAFPFAFKMVELLCGPEKRQEVHGPMVFPAGTPW